MLKKLVIFGFLIAFCVSKTLEKRVNNCFDGQKLHEIDCFFNFFQANKLVKKSENTFSGFLKIVNTNHTKISEEICMMTTNCVSKYRIPMRCGINIKMVKKAKCPCIGTYGNQCGKDFCSIDKITCDKFHTIKKSLKIEDLKEISSINNCANNQIFS